MKNGQEAQKTKTDHQVLTFEGNDKSLIGYARCSTVEQNEQRQLDALAPFGLYRIYLDKASGKDVGRTALEEMLRYIREGDTVYVPDLSRISRSAKDLLDILAFFDSNGIKFVSLKESVDTSTPTGKLLVTVVGAINEFERDIMLERQREGIAIAKRKGKYKGRKKISKPVDWDYVYGLYMSRRITATDAMRRMNLKRNTFYNFANEEKFNVEEKAV